MTPSISLKKSMGKKLLLNLKPLSILLPEEQERQEEEVLQEPLLIFQLQTMKIQAKSADNVTMKEMDSNVHLLKCISLVIHVENLWLTEKILNCTNIA